VTHDAEVAAHCQREIHIHDGKIVEPPIVVKKQDVLKSRLMPEVV
jgi:ABC-type lipoprotein export system ATPase subunit